MNASSRRGFTLPELLVVSAIVASLLGLVVAGSRPSRGTAGDIRRGAQQLASMLLKCQSVSLGNPTGAAVIIDSDGQLGQVISPARRYPYIQGRVKGGLTVVSSTSPAHRGVSLECLNEPGSALVHGYRIRFMTYAANVHGGPPSDWFSFKTGTATAAVSGSAAVSGTVSLRAETGQTVRNSIWPEVPPMGELRFEVARYPIPTGDSELLPKGVAIDLRYSGSLDPELENWGDLDDRGAIAVGFDQVGAVDALMQNVLPASPASRTVQPMSPHEDVYFLVTTAKEILDGTNTLASDKAVWVVVHTKNGGVSISANVPQQGSDATSLRAAREKARRGIVLGG